MIAWMDLPIPISGLAHVGIRVHDLARSLRFYELLGFTKTAGPIGPEPVAILDHPSGLEINLVLNAPAAAEPNVLMDTGAKHPGITLVAEEDAAHTRGQRSAVLLLHAAHHHAEVRSLDDDCGPEG